MKNVMKNKKVFYAIMIVVFISVCVGLAGRKPVQQTNQVSSYTAIKTEKKELTNEYNAFMKEIRSANSLSDSNWEILKDRAGTRMDVTVSNASIETVKECKESRSRIDVIEKNVSPKLNRVKSVKTIINYSKNIADDRINAAQSLSNGNVNGFK